MFLICRLNFFHFHRILKKACPKEYRSTHDTMTNLILKRCYHLRGWQHETGNAWWNPITLIWSLMSGNGLIFLTSGRTIEIPFISLSVSCGLILPVSRLPQNILNTQEQLLTQRVWKSFPPEVHYSASCLIWYCLIPDQCIDHGVCTCVIHTVK